MGSGSSKEKAALNSQLDELHQKYKVAVQTIALRENQITEKEKELEAANREAAETQGLKERVSELEQQISSLREEKQREVGRLQDELSRELSGQLRVAESLTQERNLARKEVGQLKDKLSSIEGGHADAIKKLEDSGKASTADSDLKRSELEKELQAKVEALSKTKREFDALKEQNLTLEESERAAGEELTAAKGKVADGAREREQLNGQLEEAKTKLAESEKARDQLTAGSRTVKDELAAAKATADGEVQKQRDLAEQLSNTQKQVAHLESTRDTLQKQNNESISKRSALHEAFQATKVELSEWVEGYKKLQGEKKGADDRVKTLEEQAKASAGSSEELQQQGEKHTGLLGERDNLVAQLSAAKQTGESADADKKTLQQELESAKKAAADAEGSKSELQRELEAVKKGAGEAESLRAELEAAKKQAAEAETLRRELEAAKKGSADGEESQRKLQTELDAMKKQGTDADEASKKRSDEHQAEIEELRKALREAKESQPKTVEKAGVSSVELPRENGVSQAADVKMPKENGHVGKINGNGAENGHAGEVKVDGETA